MTDSINIGTWNLCLGLTNKKDYIKRKLIENQLDILCVQECEVDPILDENILTIRNYKIELENNIYKKRTAIYIHNRVNYERKRNLEEQDSHVVIIDIKCIKEYRLINIYRSFSSPDTITPTERFRKQLQIIKRSMESTPNKHHIILGDFNLDYNKIYLSNYNFSSLYDELIEIFEPLGLIQMVNFETWSRFVQQIRRTSIIDHIYTQHPEALKDITPIDTEIGDHKLIKFNIAGKKENCKTVYKRDWRNYNKQNLVDLLSEIDFNMNLDCVQETWNRFENKFINVIDYLVPIVPHVNDVILNSDYNSKIKKLINCKKRLLKNKRSRNNFNQHLKLKTLNKQIKHEINFEKTKNVRRGILPGNSKSLWNAVNKAKDLNVRTLPETLTLNSINIQPTDQPDAFAQFFSSKIELITNESQINDNVYNGTRKIHVQNENFMTPENVILAIKSLKLKNCEGFDRIPVRCLIDGMVFISPILSHLFKLIYMHKTIPQQWKISKVIPLLKKGNPTKIENYRPISNLCSCSKIFEKLILMRLNQIENVQNISLTGKSQHGFKKNHGTKTIGLLLQSLLTDALDKNQYALMASLDLSAAFDVVNIGLLRKRMDIVGIPADVVSLIDTWLTERLFYVSINGDNSCLMTSNSGTIQGSILGPILYAIFVAPLFDLQKLSNYADDNYIVRWNKCIESLIIDMKKSLEAITKWLKESGLKVNESKTEICLFHRSDRKIIIIEINNVQIRSTPQINVLGVTFDSKLQWNEHIAKTIKKSNRNLHAIRIIAKFFKLDELKTFITTNFYSVLYYNSEIWHLPNIAPYLKSLLLSASAKALKLCTSYHSQSTSYVNLHEINKRATPEQFCLYKHSLLLHDLFNNQRPQIDWISINFYQNINIRNKFFETYSNSNYKIGKNNKISERLSCLNKKIPLDWLNKEIDCYKVLCKGLFLPS